RSAHLGHEPRVARARGAASEPGLTPRGVAEVEPTERRPREHRSDVQVAHREVLAAKVLPGELPLEDLERRLEALRGVVGLLRVALVLVEKRPIEEHGEKWLLQFRQDRKSTRLNSSHQIIPYD